MKEEIKEILDELESLFEISEAPEHIINGFNKIRDYITNLQEERNMFKGSFETMSKNYFEEKSRNEKAIEYIKECKELDFSDLDLLNILKGDKDND